MLGVGLFGDNGHQIQDLLVRHPKARLVGSAFCAAAFHQPPPGTRIYTNLAEMLADGEIELVSLCSPVRAEQAEQAVRCLEAGKHVYAEKPCAFTEADLDRILSMAARAGKSFHEMAGTAFEEPYLSMGEIVASGEIGEVVQVFAQKSYPYHNRRPQDEDVDGGLIRQAAVHALRLIEHTARQRIVEISATETGLGNPKKGGLRMAANLTMTLENGGIALVAANYLNQSGHGEWGNDHLRIFGAKGFVESTDGGRRTRLVVGGEDRGEIPRRENVPSYFDMLVDEILGLGKMPLTSEEELHPTRMAIRAKDGAKRC